MHPIRAVAEGDEVPGRQVGAAALVAQDHVDRRARQIAVDEHHRQRLSEEIA